MFCSLHGRERTFICHLYVGFDIFDLVLIDVSVSYMVVNAVFAVIFTLVLPSSNWCKWILQSPTQFMLISPLTVGGRSVLGRELERWPWNHKLRSLIPRRSCQLWDFFVGREHCCHLLLSADRCSVPYMVVNAVLAVIFTLVLHLQISANGFPCPLPDSCMYPFHGGLAGCPRS